MTDQSNHNTGPGTALATVGMGGSLAAVTQQHAALLALKAILRKGIDYGNIPGCGDKPTLLKPGAEKVLSRFGIAVSVKNLEDLSTEDHVRYRVTLQGTMADGTVVGEGIGECSGAEEKYAWRKAYDEEWNETPEHLRRVKRGKYKTKQVRTNPADNANTVLKMGKKRALVDLALTATAASDFYSQDLEDLSPEMREAVAAEHSTTAASTRAQTFRSQVNPAAPAPPPPVDVKSEVMASPDDRKAVWFAFCELQGWDPDNLPEGAMAHFREWVSMHAGREAAEKSSNWTRDDAEKLLGQVRVELAGGEPPEREPGDDDDIPW